MNEWELLTMRECLLPWLEMLNHRIVRQPWEGICYKVAGYFVLLVVSHQSRPSIVPKGWVTDSNLICPPICSLFLSTQSNSIFPLAEWYAI